MSAKVVAHFLNGKVLKGTSLDVNPDRDSFHVREDDNTSHQVRLSDLKALYFVKDLAGNPQRRDSHHLNPEDARLRGAKRIELRFADGEMLAGITHHFPPNRPFFFVIPADPKGNNIRILVNRSAISEFRSLEAA